MALDLSNLRKAILSLEKALNVASPQKLAAMEQEQQEVIKAGVIQNFALAYEFRLSIR
jgi:hypothetical protein